jgi:hypothetical protein
MSITGTSSPGGQVLIRFPLPCKIGESTCPSTADKKLRCEPATCIWTADHWPDVPIPYLWGFGFVGGQSVWGPTIFLILHPKLIPILIIAKPENMPWKTRLKLVPSTAHIITAWIYSVLQLYKSPPPLSLGAWISGHGLYQGSRCKDAFSDMG